MSTLARILVVDDSSTIRRVVAQVLERAGYLVSTADGGDAALATLRAEAPDLLLLDRVMPGLDGLAVLERTAGIEVPVVLMCARADPPDPVTTLRRLGVVDTITKPFSPETVLAVVSHCLEKFPPASAPAPAEATRVLPVLARTRTPAPAFGVPSPVVDVATVLSEVLSARGVPDAPRIARLVLHAMATHPRLADLEHDLERRAGTVLSGDLAAVPLPEVLQLLKFQNQTGLFEVRLDGPLDRARSSRTSPTPGIEAPRDAASDARFEVGLKAGAVVSVRARNLRADLLLGRYFLGAGLVDEAVLADQLARPSDVPLGQRLLEAGLVSHDDVRRCVGEQAEDIMYELLRARRGSFVLRQGDVMPAATLDPGFSVDMLMFEGLRRIDEWSVIEREVPSIDARFLRISHDESELTADEVSVMRACVGAIAPTVHEIVARTPMRAFDVCRLLYRLASLRRVRCVDSGGASAVRDDNASGGPSSRAPRTPDGA